LHLGVGQALLKPLQGLAGIGLASKLAATQLPEGFDFFLAAGQPGLVDGSRRLRAAGL